MDSCVCAALIVGAEDFLHLEVEIFRKIGGSALTDGKIIVPHTFPEDLPPNDEVPFRNAHFLFAGVSWAEVFGAQVVFIGAIEQDSSGYPNCRPHTTKPSIV